MELIIGFVQRGAANLSGAARWRKQLVMLGLRRTWAIPKLALFGGLRAWGEAVYVGNEAALEAGVADIDDGKAGGLADDVAEGDTDAGGAIEGGEFRIACGCEGESLLGPDEHGFRGEPLG